MQIVKIGGNIITGIGSVACSQVEASYDPKGQTTEIHNAGSDTIFIDIATGVSTADYELLMGEKIKITNKVYLICDTGLTATLKYMQLA